MKRWLFLLLMLTILVGCGLWWAYVDEGKPSKESIFFLVVSVGLLSMIRAVSVKESPIYFGISLKKKWERFKKIWFAK